MVLRPEGANLKYLSDVMCLKKGVKFGFAVGGWWYSSFNNNLDSVGSLLMVKIQLNMKFRAQYINENYSIVNDICSVSCVSVAYGDSGCIHSLELTSWRIKIKRMNSLKSPFEPREPFQKMKTIDKIILKKVKKRNGISRSQIVIVVQAHKENLF